MRLIAAALLVAAIAHNSPAFGCEWDGPYIPKLPNESKADQEKRMSEAFFKEGVLRDYRHQKQMFAEARAVFLGEIVEATRSESAQGALQASVTVRPWKALKGRLPKVVRLASTDGSGLCYPMGDGEAPFASKGDFVVVFTGLKIIKNFRPNGIDSMDVRFPLAEEIVKGLSGSGIEDLNP
jgi:hypothetical protein